MVGVNVSEGVSGETLGLVLGFGKKAFQCAQNTVGHVARSGINQHDIVTIGDKVCVNNVGRKAGKLPEVWGYEAHNC